MKPETKKILNLSAISILAGYTRGNLRPKKIPKKHMAAFDKFFKACDEFVDYFKRINRTVN